MSEIPCAMLTPNDPRLFLLIVTDDLRDGVDGLVARTAAAVEGGASMVLLRLKHSDARTAADVGRMMIAAVSAPLIVHERCDVALAIGAAGVQLSSTSIPIVALRPRVPPGFLFGMSVSSTADLERARTADYVTIGPVFGSATAALGVSGFRTLAEAIGLPAIAIGGIDATTTASARSAGASGVAALGGVLGAPDPRAAAAELLASLQA